MIFTPPLLPARLLRRYKRFLADLVLEATGEAITAHCPNPGAMLGVAPEGARAFVSHSADPKRQLAYTLRLVEADGTWVGIDTGMPNKLAREAIEAGAIPELSGYAAITPEARYGAEKSRIDLLLTHPERPPCYVEVKNVHLRRTGTLAEFPDCVTARGAKHLRELSRVVEAGGRAVALFVIQRGDCDSFAPAPDLDPAWAAAFAAARAAGVEALAYGCDVSPDGIALRKPLKMPPLGRGAGHG